MLFCVWVTRRLEKPADKIVNSNADADNQGNGCDDQTRHDELKLFIPVLIRR